MKIKCRIILLTIVLVFFSCSRNFDSMIFNEYMKVYHDSYLKADLKVIRFPKLILGDTIILDSDIEFFNANSDIITSETETIFGYAGDSLVLINHSGMLYEFELLKIKPDRVVISKRNFEHLYCNGEIIDYKINFYEKLISSKNEFIDSLLLINNINMEKLNRILSKEYQKRYGETWVGIPF